MLMDLLTPELVSVHAHAADWRETIEIAGSLFEKTGRCDHSYTEAMIASVEKFGPYMVLEEGIAMPHAQSQDNVSEQGVCVVTLDEGVAFGNEDFDPVWVLVGICAPDPTAHLGCLKELSRMFEIDDVVEKLRACATADEVLAFMRSVFVA